MNHEVQAKSNIDTTFNLKEFECVDSGTPDEISVWTNGEFDLLEKNGVIKYIERIEYIDIDSMEITKRNFYYH